MTSVGTEHAASALIWVKSSYSDNEGGNCVEVADATPLVRIRDSKTPDGPVLTVPRKGWTRFLHFAAAR